MTATADHPVVHGTDQRQASPITSTPALQFGIYPLSVAGTPLGLAVGPPDDGDQITAALGDLAGEAAGVLPRTYLVYAGPGKERSTLALADRYRTTGLLGHVTLGSVGDAFDLDRWLDVVAAVVRQFGGHLTSLQITNEPNLTFMEGANPNIVEALVHGVLAAKFQARQCRLNLDIGFGSVPQSPVALPSFWQDLATVGGTAFIDAIDFVGHNFYVDVFEAPVDPADIPGRVEDTLRGLRFRDLVAAGIPPSVPVRVTENGWPTGTNPLTNNPRSYERQASTLETIIRTIHGLRGELNVTHYMLFGLRDADSSKPDPFHQFGILRDDYTPKPAYQTFKNLIGELSVNAVSPAGRGP